MSTIGSCLRRTTGTRDVSVHDGDVFVWNLRHRQVMSTSCAVLVHDGDAFVCNLRHRQVLYLELVLFQFTTEMPLFGICVIVKCFIWNWCCVGSRRRCLCLEFTASSSALSGTRAVSVHDGDAFVCNLHHRQVLHLELVLF